MKLLLAGEGTNDLGGWGGDPVYRDPTRRGALVALLERACGGTWEVAGARTWSTIRLYDPGNRRARERRRVLGLLAEAQEAGFDAVAFSRDTDGEEGREAEVEAALAEAPVLLGAMPRIIGGVAVQRLESWILALTGRRGTEAMSDARVDEALAALGVESKDGQAMVALIDAADLSAIPEDAAALLRWLGRARTALGERTPAPEP